MTDIGIPFYDDTPEGRRYAIRYQIAQWRFEQWSGSELLDWLRGAGLGIRDADFYQIRDERLSGPPHFDEFTSYDDDRVLPLAWMENQTQWNMRTNYMYVVNVIGRDKDTGDEISMTKLVGSDGLLSKEEIYDRLNYLMDELGSDTQHELLSASVIRGYVRA